MDKEKIQIETEFNGLKNWYASSKRKGTSTKDVLRFMVENYKVKLWWWSWEFVGKTHSRGGYLSHKAPARASDLAIHNPELVEDRKIGRFKVYRVKRENREAVLNYLK